MMAVPHIFAPLVQEIFYTVFVFGGFIFLCHAGKQLIFM